MEEEEEGEWEVEEDGIGGGCGGGVGGGRVSQSLKAKAMNEVDAGLEACSVSRETHLCPNSLA